MRFAVPEPSSSLEFPSIEEPVTLSEKHNRTGITVQEHTSSRVKAGDVEEKPEPTLPAEIPMPRLSQKQFARTALSTKIKKGPSLRERVSKFFTRSHNAPLEQRRVISQSGSPTSSPNYILLKSSDHTHRPTLLEEQPHTSCLSHIQPVYEDGSSIADCSTPEKSPDEGHESCSGNALAKPGHRDTQPPNPAQSGKVSTTPTDEAYARIAGSFPSEMNLSDQVIFNSRHGKGPFRGLYRDSRTHHEQLMQDRLAQAACEQQAHNTVAWDNGNDWLTSPANSDSSLKDLWKAIPPSHFGARQLAALNPGHRGGVIISNTPLSRSVSKLTSKEADNASREWQLQASGSVADANVEFHGVDLIDGVKRFGFSFSDSIDISDLREVNIPCAAAQAGCGPDVRHTVWHRPSQSLPGRLTGLRPNLDNSLVSSDSFDHDVHANARATYMQPQKHVRARAKLTADTNPKTMRSRSRSPGLPLPLIPTGSDILRAATADPHADQTPIAFRNYHSDIPFPDDPSSHLAHSRMVSTSQVPLLLPLPLPKYMGEGEYDYEDAGEPVGRVDDGGEDEALSCEDADENEAASLATTATTPPPPPPPPQPQPPSAIPQLTNATTRILHLVHALEDQRNEVTGQNRALLVAVEQARRLLRGAEAAYDAAERGNQKKIGKLKRKNRELREENGVLLAEAGRGRGRS